MYFNEVCPHGRAIIRDRLVGINLIRKWNISRSVQFNDSFIGLQQTWPLKGHRSAIKIYTFAWVENISIARSDLEALIIYYRVISNFGPTWRFVDCSKWHVRRSRLPSRKPNKDRISFVARWWMKVSMSPWRASLIVMASLGSDDDNWPDHHYLVTSCQLSPSLLGEANDQ